uniref:NACHT domain-containing protein n=1 Tax=Otus sunia TaxID=257818 RepID=A0A8C8APA3_9STRI
MLDLFNDNLDSEAQQLLSNLKAKIASHYPKHFKVHTLAYSKDSGNPHCKENNKYLKQLCEQFTAVTYHWVLKNLQIYWTLIFTMLGRTIIKPTQPSSFMGPPGCGKTAVTCKLSELLQAVLGQDSGVVIRLLGTSQCGSATLSLLRDICLQACLAFDLPPPPAQPRQACSGLVLFLSELLLAVSRCGPQTLVVFLDSVERLLPGDGAHRFRWLPADCPPKVHIIISISTAEPDTLKALQHAVPEAEACFEVGPLSCEEMLEMLLASERHQLSPAQQLAFHEARKWASYTSLSELVIAGTAQDTMNQLCKRPGKSHGTVLVAHGLGYIASSENRLSDMEVKDILSLEDEVPSKIHQFYFIQVKLSCASHLPTGHGSAATRANRRQMASPLVALHTGTPGGQRRRSQTSEYGMFPSWAFKHPA